MKLTLREVPVYSLVTIRMLIASVLILPFVVKNLKVRKSDIKLLILAALLGTNIHLALFFIGLKLTAAISASILVATVPIFTLVAASLFLREKLTIRLMAAVAVATIGLVIIVGIPASQTNGMSTLGNILLIGSSASWVAYEITSKKLMKQYSPFLVTFYIMIIGALIFLPLSVWDFIKDPLWPTRLTSSGIAGLIYGILFASTIAYSAWQKGLSLLGAGQASFFFYLDPVTGIIFSILLLGEKLTLPLTIGALLIVWGVILAEGHRRNHPLHRKL